jgi:hypothetical protein
MNKAILALCLFLGTCLFAADSPTAPAPTKDRVGFPTDYRKTFQVLRVVNRPEKKQVVTIYGNKEASAVKEPGELPYPYGTVIVMETASAKLDSSGIPSKDEHGNFLAGDAVGMHVMRREKGFGEAYENARAGEWEFVEYKPDGTFITPPAKSAACSECHVKAGAKRDFVYQARLGHFFESK